MTMVMIDDDPSCFRDAETFLKFHF